MFRERDGGGGGGGGGEREDLVLGTRIDSLPVCPAWDTISKLGLSSRVYNGVKDGYFERLICWSLDL